MCSDLHEPGERGLPIRDDGSLVWDLIDPELEKHAEDVIDSLAPKTWDLTVWVGSNYLAGRLDVADRKRLVMTVLAMSHSGRGES